MDYTVEDISPVKKKVSISVSPDEVDAAIKSATALYRKNVQMDGFRKGKAPLSTVERRFHDSIYKEAHDDLINVHINDVLGKLNLQPISGIVVNGEEQPLKKGESYAYSLEFEIMPDFVLPPYEGLEVEEEEFAAEPGIVDHMLKRMQRERSTLTPVAGNAPAADGQIANLDFETFLDGKPVDKFKAANFDLELGQGSALPEFEEFVKSIPVGHTAEKVIHFPDDFIAPELAGKDALMKVTVHAVKERKLPELDDKFAEQTGRKDMEDLRQSLAESYAQGMRLVSRGVTQKKLLDALVAQTEFDLPQGMVDRETTFLVGDMIAEANAAGKNPARTPEELEKLKEETRPKAEARTREKILLLTIAKKENLEISNEEVEREVVRGAYKFGMDPLKYFEQMRETGMIYMLRDTMLCDKAMDLVYERANVKLVPEAQQPHRSDPEQTETEQTEPVQDEPDQPGQSDSEAGAQAG